MAEPPIGDLADRLLSAKEKSGKTFDQIADELGFRNTHTYAVVIRTGPAQAGHAPEAEESRPWHLGRGLRNAAKGALPRLGPGNPQGAERLRDDEAITHYGNAIKL